MQFAALQQNEAGPIFPIRKGDQAMEFTRNIRQAFKAMRSDPAERYLNEATSLLDLEQREREIARGRFVSRNLFR
ncbi:hypothetical protein GCM10011390_27500 [Aureimonas endophytica]|uniref:DUF3563 domain-containing protein n=2 Tax=Aureimonas endophytica TaxID=2027858 RepID=A0A917E5K7_9HYPH|nr:hypothetical protein GCM10011390_27500 [Aureimonas endophytica]